MRPFCQITCWNYYKGKLITVLYVNVYGNSNVRIRKIANIERPVVEVIHKKRRLLYLGDVARAYE